MRAIIITGGQIDDKFACNWIESHPYDCMIAADSGMNFLHRNGIVPNVVAGDFDSVNAESLDVFSKMENVELLRLNPIKDDTDTEFVIREAIRRGAKEITILGATGTRLDHVLGNMHLLGIGIKEQVSIQLVDTHNRIRMVEKECTLLKAEQFGDFVSLLPICGDVKGVTLRGMKYPLTDAVIPSFSSLGISNEIIEDKATISIKEGVLLVIESKDR
uniref:thiamine diphosphokinase n=1 Tax=Agathobacter sp. TaxID=2021311 RepID=UPI00405730CB